MKRMIHNFLDRNYSVKRGGLFLNSDRYSTTSAALIKQLAKVFNLDSKKLKWYIKSWWNKENRGRNFKNYWESPWSEFDFRDDTFILEGSMDIVTIPITIIPTKLVYYETMDI